MAATAAWLAAFVATLPVQLYEFVTVASGDRRLLVDSTAYGLLVWAVLTMAMSAAGLVIVLGPVATLFSARSVTRHPVVATGLLPLLSLMGLAGRFYWEYKTEIGPYVPIALYPAYSIFIVVFFSTASAVYYRLIRRGLNRRTTANQRPGLDEGRLGARLN